MDGQLASFGSRIATGAEVVTDSKPFLQSLLLGAREVKGPTVDLFYSARRRGA